MRHFPALHQRTGLAQLPWLTLLSLLGFGCAKGAPIDESEIVILTSLPGDDADAGVADAAASTSAVAPTAVPAAPNGASTASKGDAGAGSSSGAGR